MHLLYQKAYILVIVFAIIIYSCKKDELNRETKVETKSIVEIMATSAKVESDIIDLGNGIINYSYCWGFLMDPDIFDSKTSFGGASKTGNYVSELINLAPPKTYHIRAYIISGENVFYGFDFQFTTPNGLAIVSTTNLTNLTVNSATSGGNITNDGGSSITSRGVCEV